MDPPFGYLDSKASYGVNCILCSQLLIFTGIWIAHTGKIKAEAIGDVAKGNETMEYATSMPQLIPG